MDRKTFFNEMASCWDERFYTNKLKKRLAEIVLLFNIKSNELILDVGTGTGGIIPYLLDYTKPYGFIHAIDFAEEMIKIAKRKFFHENRVEFHVCSVYSIPFQNRFFDKIICFGAFPHFEDKSKALREMNRVLKNSCSLIISHAMSSQEIKEHHNKAEVVKNDCLPTEKEMAILLESTGFIIKRLYDQPGLYLCEAQKVLDILS